MLRKKYEEEVGSVAEERTKREEEEHRSLMALNDAENLTMHNKRWVIFSHSLAVSGVVC